MTSDDKKGVCFAFEVIEHGEHDYELNLYFADTAMKVARFANGIPS